MNSNQEVGTTFRLVFELGVSHFDDKVDIIISDLKVPTNDVKNELLVENNLEQEQPEKEEGTYSFGRR